MHPGGSEREELPSGETRAEGPAAAPVLARRSRLTRLLLGPPSDPAWARPLLLGIVAATGLLYLWGLDRVGYGNTFYAAAAASGASSWKAWFFGAFDSAGFITIDKPPASIWLTGLSIRLFGLSAWSVLVPQALAGMATVAVLYATVRRWFGAPAALMSAAAMAVTPVAVVMFRYNNPDAVLTFLMVAAVALGLRAAESGKPGWVLAAFGVAGFGFLAKTTEALLVLPALVAGYLVSAPVSLRRRLLHVGLGVATFVLAAGWWIALVELVPDASRPYIGGTDTNSVLEYALFGYNGVDRLLGEGSSARNGAWGGVAGWTRLFNEQVGSQVSWLVPLAIVGLAAGLWLGRRHPRHDPRRAGWVLWGAAFVTHLAVLSFMSGIFHPYYTLTMVPAIAALAGAGVVALWRAYRAGGPAAGLLPVAVALTGWWAWVLLDRTPEFAPGLGAVVLAATAAAALALALLRLRRPGRALAGAAAGMGLVMLLAGPAAYAVEAIGNPATGGDPRAGPASEARAAAALDEGLAAYLTANRGEATWLVATEGHASAAAIMLATGEPVLAMGGFNGEDPVPTAADLAGYVTDGVLRFVLLSSGSTGASTVTGGGAADAERAAWVVATCTPVESAGTGEAGVLYDCSA